jgi:aspartate ammonia-lyase
MTRRESDVLGSREIPEAARYGIHTVRALENFRLSGRPVHAALSRAYGAVKLAAVRTNRALGYLPDPAIADALERACAELLDGTLVADILVDALQGGAGTSTNFNVNEVIANRALEIAGETRGRYDRVSPSDHVNLHQSTNDTFPTALRIAAIWSLR